MKKFWAVFVARNKEFVRDRASFGWSLLFPFLLLLGFGFMLGGDGQDVFKVAVLGTVPEDSGLRQNQLEEEHSFFTTKHVQFIEVEDLDDALLKVGQHRYDLLLDPGHRTDEPRYWINSSSAKGYLTERILWGASTPDTYQKQEIEGKEVRYIDWLMPGLLSMNMMFGALFGVGGLVRHGPLPEDGRLAPTQSHPAVSLPVLVGAGGIALSAHHGNDRHRLHRLQLASRLSDAGFLCSLDPGVRLGNHVRDFARLGLSRTHRQRGTGWWATQSHQLPYDADVRRLVFARWCPILGCQLCQDLPLDPRQHGSARSHDRWRLTGSGGSAGGSPRSHDSRVPEHRRRTLSLGIDESQAVALPLRGPPATKELRIGSHSV